MASYLVELVWFKKPSIPILSFLGRLEVAQIFFPGWVGLVSVQFDLSGTGQLELSLAINDRIIKNSK